MRRSLYFSPVYVYNIYNIYPFSKRVGNLDLNFFLILFQTREKLEDNRLLVGSLHESRSHWTFVAIDLERARILYIDPFGNEVAKHIILINNFERFCIEWNAVENKKGEYRGKLPTSFKAASPPHCLQQPGDGRSCGIYVCMVTLIFTNFKKKMTILLPFSKRINV